MRLALGPEMRSSFPTTRLLLRLLPYTWWGHVRCLLMLTQPPGRCVWTGWKKRLHRAAERGSRFIWTVNLYGWTTFFSFAQNTGYHRSKIPLRHTERPGPG